MPFPSARVAPYSASVRGTLKVGTDDPIWHDDAATPGRTRSRRISVLVGVILAVLVVGGYSLTAVYLSRQDYGTFAFWRVPSRIDYCGRRYFPGGIVRGPASAFTSEVDPVAEPRWETVGHTFSLRPIQAPVLGRRELSSVCAMAVYVPVGGGRYEFYSLSGGP